METSATTKTYAQAVSVLRQVTDASVTIRDTADGPVVSDAASDTPLDADETIRRAHHALQRTVQQSAQQLPGLSRFVDAAPIFQSPERAPTTTAAAKDAVACVGGDDTACERAAATSGSRHRADDTDAGERLEQIFADITKRPGMRYFVYDPTGYTHGAPFLATEWETGAGTDILIGRLTHVASDSPVHPLVAEANRTHDGYIVFAVPDTHATPTVQTMPGMGRDTDVAHQLDFPQAGMTMTFGTLLHAARAAQSGVLIKEFALGITNAPTMMVPSRVAPQVVRGGPVVPGKWTARTVRSGAGSGGTAVNLGLAAASRLGRANALRFAETPTARTPSSLLTRRASETPGAPSPDIPLPLLAGGVFVPFGARRRPGPSAPASGATTPEAPARQSFGGDTAPSGNRLPDAVHTAMRESLSSLKGKREWELTALTRARRIADATLVQASQQGELALAALATRRNANGTPVATAQSTTELLGLMAAHKAPPTAWMWVRALAAKARPQGPQVSGQPGDVVFDAVVQRTLHLYKKAEANGKTLTGAAVESVARGDKQVLEWMGYDRGGVAANLQGARGEIAVLEWALQNPHIRAVHVIPRSGSGSTRTPDLKVTLRDGTIEVWDIKTSGGVHEQIDVEQFTQSNYSAVSCYRVIMLGGGNGGPGGQLPSVIAPSRQNGLQAPVYVHHLKSLTPDAPQLNAAVTMPPQQ